MQQLKIPIVERRRLSSNSFEITLGLKDNRFSFEPGQHISLILKKLLYPDNRGNRRDFSLISSPRDRKYLKIAFRNSDSGFKKTLRELPLGSLVEINGPFGVFYLKKNSKKNSIFIAGGIGVTPFLSMLQSAVEENLPQKYTLIYINSNLKRLIYQEKLNDLVKKSKRIKIIYRFGRAGRRFYEQNLTNLKYTNFFVAGPLLMVEDTHRQLAKIGVPEKNIYSEQFSGYENYIDNIPQTEKILVEKLYQLGFGLEGELRERSPADLKALLQTINASAIVSESNAQGTITYVNDKAVDISKYSREELVGQNHRILKSGFHSTAFYENLWSTISRGNVWRGEIKNRAKDGTYYWVDTSIAPILGRDKKPMKYISVRFPITERKQAEAELKKRVGEQAVIASLSQQAMASANLQTLQNKTVKLVAKSLSLKFCKILEFIPNGSAFLVKAGIGWKKGFIGSTIQSNSGYYNQLTYLLKSKLPIIIKNLQSETRFVGSQDLQDHGVVSGINVLIHGLDRPYGILSVFSDKRRLFSKSDVNFLQTVASILANAERLLLERRKDEFISTASHELRTPLTSVKGFTQLLQRQFSGSDDKKTYLFLSKIDSQLNKLTTLIGDLLDITKINSGKLQYNDEFFKLTELISEILGDFKLTVKKHSIFYQDRIKNTEIFADKFRIGQVLINLINNAIKYSPDADKIIIASYLNGRNAVVSVQDYGVGISREDQAHVFERFFQGSNVKRLHFPGGLGIGLFISSEIIKRYKGKIWIKSYKGKGSTVYFSLPLKRI